MHSEESKQTIEEEAKKLSKPKKDLKLKGDKIGASSDENWD
jgi:hypothetical protein